MKSSIAAIGLTAVLGAVVISARQTPAGDWPFHDGDAGRHPVLAADADHPGKRRRPRARLDVRYRPEQPAADAAGRGRHDVRHGGQEHLGPRAGDGEGDLDVHRTRHGQPPRRRVLAWRWPTPPRIFSGAGDRLLALDAKTGQPAAGFGDGGYVDLKAQHPGDVDGAYQPRLSALDRLQNIVITGGNNGEQSPSLGLYGDIRGWDAKTGKLLWSFHTVPRAGEAGRRDLGRRELEEPLGHQHVVVLHGRRRARHRLRAARVADRRLLRRRSEGRRTCTATRSSRSTRATGKLKWHQQLVHHDLWDFDLPAAPTLVDVRRDGKTIPAVARHHEDRRCCSSSIG